MAILLPNSKTEFLQVNGVGEKKLDKYGEVFLKEIAGYREKHAGNSVPGPA
ncbi:MAG: HRDC domain-containing protein [Gammaproteobacteria bacterium]|nr:HRDC domain-containing protein [Gammaproteobacteria bacterium]